MVKNNIYNIYLKKMTKLTIKYKLNIYVIWTIYYYYVINICVINNKYN